MATSIEQLQFISQQINIYLGLFILLTGVFGSLANIWLFTRKRSRRSPCSRYILTGSVFDFIQLSLALIFTILYSGFGVSTLNTTLVECLSRFYLMIISQYVSVCCRCLAAFDGFLSTSRSPRIRNLSSIKVAHRLISINIIFWFLINVPILIYMKVVQRGPAAMGCAVLNQEYADFLSRALNLVIYFVVPPAFLIGFMVGTLINIKQMNAGHTIRQMEKQLIMMTSMQALFFMFGSLPYCVQLIYGWCTANVPKDSFRLAQESLFSTISRLLYVSTFASPFYIYVLSSREIRGILRGIMSTSITDVSDARELVAVSRARVAPTTAPSIASVAPKIDFESKLDRVAIK